jgi:hypothetical protein
MKHLQFVFLFAAVISAHLALEKFPAADGWKKISESRQVASTSTEPVMYYASINPGIRQLKWRCLSGELRIRRIVVNTRDGEQHAYTLSPSVLHAGLSTRPLDLSDFHSNLESVAIWYDSSDNHQDESLAKLELLGSMGSGSFAQ